MRVNFKSPAQLSRHGDHFGFGRVYQSLMREFAKRDDILLTESIIDADLQVCLCLPHNVLEYYHWWGRHRHEIQVVYCTWETTRIPDGWRDILNEMAAVFVTSNWNKEVFAECGVTSPIYVVPHGVDADDFPYLERNWLDGKFVFLWQGMHRGDRKGRILAQDAFEQLNLPNTTLVLKWYPMISKCWGPQFYRERNILEIGQFLSKPQYLELLQSCHVSVNPFQGEGFALMPLECASTGMATMLTNWSGAMDYINSEAFKPLKYKLCEPGKDYISTCSANECTQDPAQDARVDVDHLMESMLYFYENRKAAEEMGWIAHQYVSANWTWERAANKFVNACKKVLGDV